VAKLGLKHGQGIVCADPNCCQGYIGAEDYIDKWGVSEPVESARKAVLDTEGVVLCYRGELIDATYFSCSGGMTEDAVAVWGADVPYLRSVESPGEEESDHYMQTLRYKPVEFSQRLGVVISSAPEHWISDVTYTDGGGVEKMTICGKSFSGTQLRKLLNLRSTCFTILADADDVVITTLGFGHRVGMSQYGADAMAKSGCSYKQILLHYYQNVQLAHLITQK
jgi:stage II sporulation protein D